MDWDKHLPAILSWGGAIVTGIFTLLGVLLANRSSLKQLTVKLQNEADRETREVLRQRLEELYSLVGRWSNDVVMHHLTYRRVMEGDLTYNQALDITIGDKNVVDANRLFTLAQLYFPSAHGSLKKLMDCRDDAAAIQSSFKQHYKQAGQPSRAHAKELTAVLEQFNAAITDYRQELAEHARNI